MLSDNTKAELLLRQRLEDDKPFLRELAVRRAHGLRVLKWGEMALEVSEPMVALLELLYPDFTARDRQTKNAAWRWFADSEWGRPYRCVNARRRYE